MHNVRKVFAYILCLCLLLPACALAAEGDTVLRGGWFFDVMMRGEELVLFGGTIDGGIYTWKMGEEDLSFYPWGESFENVVFSPEWTYYTEFSDGENIYFVSGTSKAENGSLELQYVSLWKIVLDNNEANIVEVEDSHLDWDALPTSHDIYFVQNSVYLNGVLYCIAESDSHDMEACAVPLDGSYSYVLDDVPSPLGISTYKDGKLLFWCRDLNQNLYDDNEYASFVAWDPALEEAEELCTISVDPKMYHAYYYDPVSFTYDEVSDRVYYAQFGAVVALNLDTGETEEVNDIPLLDESEIGAVMLPGGYFALAREEEIIVRNTDPGERAAYRLTISNPSNIEPINSAIYSFSDIRPDVSVKIDAHNEPPRIIEDLMTQSTQYDIYVVNSTDQSFDSVFHRGYMAELSDSEKIDKLFADMYPAIADQLRTNGVPVAVPLTATGSSTLGVYKSALEKAGMTMDDIPTNWLDLLDSLDELHARLAGTGVSLFADWHFVNELRPSLLFGILEDYLTYMNQTDPAMGFNTDVLRSVLQKLSEVDFEALGVMSYEESLTYENDSLSDCLFRIDTSCTISGSFDEFEPLLLSMTSETSPYLRLQLGVAFINPYSPNKDIAQQFLECALDNVQEATIASICDIDVEPKRMSSYESEYELSLEELASLQNALATAEAAEKQSIEEQIRDAQLWLEEMDAMYWEISPMAIEWYRSHDDFLAVDTFNVLYSADNYAEINTVLEQYQDGAISTEQFLQTLDDKLQMSILEGAY